MAMDLPMEMLIDYMAYLNPELRLRQRNQWVKGIKLMPAEGKLDPGYLYFARVEELRRSSGEAPLVVICPETAEAPPELDNCIILHTSLDVADVFNQFLGTQNLIRQWGQEMELSISRREGVQKLLDISGRVFGNPIAVISTSFKTIAATWEQETDDPVFWELLELGYLTRDTYLRMQEAGFFSSDYYAGKTVILEPGELNSAPMAFTAISREGSVGFSVLMLYKNTALSPGTKQLYEYFVEKLRYYLLPAAETEDYMRSQFDSFIIDIIEGRVSNPRDIMERSLIYPPTYTADYSTVLIIHEGSSAMYLEHAMQNLSSIFPNVRQILYNNSIILHPDLSGSRARREHFLSTLADYLPGARAYAGISESFTGLVTIRESYRQAREALSLGRRFAHVTLSEQMLGNASRRRDRIYHFRDYHVYSLLSGNDRSPGVLQQIRRHDMDHGSDYYRMLYLFLSLERSYTDVAKILGMHRNNVIYHAKRMSELLSLDLDDHNQRLRLLLLYRVDDLLAADSKL